MFPSHIIKSKSVLGDQRTHGKHLCGKDSFPCEMYGGGCETVQQSGKHKHGSARIILSLLI